MSATGRSDVRREDDYYATPAWCVHRLLEAHPFADAMAGRWLEPCAGDGAIIRAVPGEHIVWSANEIRRAAQASLEGLPGVSVTIGDFLDLAHRKGFQGWEYDVVITNPPYALAMEFIEACLPLASEVAMLLRLNFLASEKRAAFMRSYPPDVYVLPNRPSFTGNGTDATEYCWALWSRKDRKRPEGKIRVLATTPIADRIADRKGNGK